MVGEGDMYRGDVKKLLINLMERGALNGILRDLVEKLKLLL